METDVVAAAGQPEAGEWSEGSWLIETQWRPDAAGAAEHVTTLYAVVHKVASATRYRVEATGFDDPLHYGSCFRRSFDAQASVPASADWSDTSILDRGDAYWICLSRAVGPGSEAEQARRWLAARFRGLRIRAEAT
jgi:hypothetical protein